MRGPRRAVAALAAVLLLAGCSSGPDPSAQTAVAEDYFTALAEADYDRMAELSTGLARTAALYGQQVLMADPDAFSPRDLEVVDPLAVGEDGHLDGALDLRTKGLDDGGLRITDITMGEGDDGGWLVADYARDGRPLSEVFRPIAAAEAGEGHAVAATVVLTDEDAALLLVPVVVTAGAQDVTVDPAMTSVSGQASTSVSLEGDPVVAAGSEGVVAVVVRDLPDPARAMTLVLGLQVGGTPVAVALDLRGSSS